MASSGLLRGAIFAASISVVCKCLLRCFDSGVRSCLTPEKPQQRITLFTQPTEPLAPSTGIFLRNHSHITSQVLAVRESCWIAQEYLGRQCRDRPHSWVRHQQSCSGAFASLLFHSLV